MSETHFTGPLEIRTVGDALELAGVVMKYGNKAAFGGFEESFAPGSLRPHPAGVVLNLQHNHSAALARSPGTLTLVDGPEELRMTARMPATAAAADVATLVKAGVLQGLSVEFHAKRDRWVGQHRLILEAEMTGLAVCDRGIYPASQVESRAADLAVLWQAAQPVITGWVPGL